jgi:uncharacterized repeat protein (TIGR01451 family)
MKAHVRRMGPISALAGVLVLAITPPASAAPPPVSVVMAEPFQGGAIVVERTAGEMAGQPDRWRMNQDIWLQNTGGSTLVLDEITIAYSGGSDPPDLTVSAASFNAIADDPMNLNQIPAGDTSRVRVPEERIHAFPIADSVSVSITFDGFDPIAVNRNLAEYIGDGPLGSLAFPGAAKDLPPGEYWAHGTGHQLRDHHRNQWWERFAEDWSVRRWDGSSWTQLTDDPGLLGNNNWNDDYLIWGKGLYVPVAGEIIACANGHADDSFPNEDVAGVGDYGNFVWIDTGAARVLYAHIQQGTMPASICPVDPSQPSQTPNPPTPVELGQFVGRAGNTGNTSNPHLHIDVQRDSDGQGLPLRYHNTQAASSKAFDPNTDPPPWNDVNDAAISMEDTNPGVGMLTLPNPRANVTGELVASPDPVAAGTQLTYDVTIANLGPDAAGLTTATITVPPELDYASDTGGCTESPSNVLTCTFNLGALGANGEVDDETFQVVADVPADLVHNNGSPVEVTATGTVSSPVFDDDTAPFEVTSTVIAEADLELLSVDAIDPPTELTIGEPQNVVIREVMTNHGPSAPMDTRVDRTAVATANATVAPAATSHVEAALALQEERTVEETFEVACVQPGSATFTFSTTISPDRPDDIDPDPSNNGGMTAFSVECIVPVAINIKPGSFVNPVVIKSNGIIPIAVLTTEAGEYDLPLAFDATTIHALTARFGPGPVVAAGDGAFEAHDLGHLEDARERSDEVTLDGDLDMVLHYRTQESSLTGTEVEACVRGLFGPNDWVFHGCDGVTFTP